MSDWKRTLADLLREHNGTTTGGRTASAATRDKRSDVLFAAFAELRRTGVKLEDVRQFKGKHVKKLCEIWQNRGLSASTLQNNLSILRTFAGWIGKQGMVETDEKYFHGASARTTINNTDKSWKSNSVDVERKLAEVRAKDERVALALELQHAFGLRVKESLMLRPHFADQGSVLDVSRGTKNGRPRVVPIDTPERRAAIERAKAMCGRMESVAGNERALAQAKNHFYHVVRSCGIARENGIVPHGLRHEYANDRFEEKTGTNSPVRGGNELTREADYATRLEIAEELGHSREDVTTHYLGR